MCVDLDSKSQVVDQDDSLVEARYGAIVAARRCRTARGNGHSSLSAVLLLRSYRAHGLNITELAAHQLQLLHKQDLV